MAQNITEIIRAIAEQSMPHIVIGYIQTVEPLEVILIDDINISLLLFLPENSRCKQAISGTCWQ